MFVDKATKQQSVGSNITVPCSSSSPSWSKIGEDMRQLPNFTIQNIIQYFIYQKEIDGLERQDWKSLNNHGYKLFKEGHIQQVHVSSSSKVAVKAICLPEMKKDRTYSLQLSIDKSTVNICAAECSCPAGKGPIGSCKHLAALCFAIEDFVKMRNIALEQGEESCTSFLQRWNQPQKRRLDSKTVEDISFTTMQYDKQSNTRVHHKSYDPRPPSLRRTTQLDLDEFLEQLESLQVASGFVHLLKQPSSSDAPNAVLPLLPRSVQTRIQHKVMQNPLPPTLEIIKDHGMEFIEGITPTADEKKAIEEKTRLQSSAVRWHEERYCRLTASNFGRVYSCRSGFEKLAKTILFVKVPAGVASNQWGRDHEATAHQEYQDQLSHFYPNYTLRKAGFVVGDPAYLGASPDGALLDDAGVLKGIIEIKCPYSAMNVTVREACTMLNDFYCFLDDNNDLRLKSNHAYYYQVQGTMAMANVPFCDFIVWTPKSMERIVIKFDQELWQNLYSKLIDFYTEYMLPLIIY